MLVIVFFGCYTPQGNYRECSYGADDIETCLEALSGLVRQGWQISCAKLDINSGQATLLPVEAFDGQPLKRPIRLLQEQWGEILLT